jgi:PhoH-like ATPase
MRVFASGDPAHDRSGAIRASPFEKIIPDYQDFSGSTGYIRNQEFDPVPEKIRPIPPHLERQPHCMKNYVLDTTVLLYDSQALFAFEDNHVIVPIHVIEDIDQFKKDLSETGRNARQTSRVLDDLRRRGNLSNGVSIDSKGTIAVKIGTEDALRSLPVGFNDKRNNILAVALAVKKNSPGIPTILVSKDINLRVKADALGLSVEDYETEKIDIQELYAGHCRITAESSQIESLEKEGFLPWSDALFPNEYVEFVDKTDPSRNSLGRYIQHERRIKRIERGTKGNIWRIVPRNTEQTYAMDALLDDSIQLVTLVGKAGTGKTLLAIAASLYKTVDENTYSRILVSRPIQPLGKDIGYLPGTVEEKLSPWMYPIVDNVEYLMRSDRAKHPRRGFHELVEMGILVVEPLTYIRGRSIHNQFLIVDEAQNLTPHELKTIITRIGDGTKIIVTGDPYQIDNPYIDSSSNGLTYVVEKFKNQDIAAHVTLTKGERSKLSELAANLL